MKRTNCLSPVRGKLSSFKTSALLTAGACALSLNVVAKEIFVINKNAADYRVVETNDSDKRIDVYSNTPHRYLNSEKKEHVFSGVPVSELSSKEWRYDNVYFIGDDDYITFMPAQIANHPQTILASAKDAAPLSKRDGEVQVILPTREEAKVEDKYLKKAAFWAWYVKAVVYGELNNSLQYGDASIDMTNVMGEPAQAYKAPSVFSYDPIVCPDTYQVSVKDLDPGFDKGEVEFLQLNGNHRTYGAGDVMLIFSKEDTALPVECGGPYAVRKGEEYIYSVYSFKGI
ncbi:hypothetical protein O5O45_21960 [Hahella aquimaris]|uniref:hypothetical protein n=1 Tax=Hahella sp. HNIBRBA332 TaxID=3015983 RepID=UPI00273C4329|nr:hypothetical protein [Hahella sp. HNIBRBA332]WLQ12396.1 hypothetical protein O5O45_21960 [Hahella sp. HNIBRBA332]